MRFLCRINFACFSSGVSSGAILSIRMRKKYELMIVFNPDFSESEVAEQVSQLKAHLEAEGSAITFEDYWGKQKLSYPIKKHDSGHYQVLEFELSPERVNEFEKDLYLNKYIIRHLLILLEDGVKQQKFEELSKVEGKKEVVRKFNHKPGSLKKEFQQPKKPEPEEKQVIDKKVLDEKLEKLLRNDLDI